MEGGGGRIVGLLVNYIVGLGSGYMPFFFYFGHPPLVASYVPLVCVIVIRPMFIAFALLPVVSAQAIDCILWAYKQIHQK